jgi:hypothetical protein
MFRFLSEAWKFPSELAGFSGLPEHFQAHFQSEELIGVK